EATAAMLRARQEGQGLLSVLGVGLATAFTGTDAHRWNVEFSAAVDTLMRAQQTLERTRAAARASNNSMFDPMTRALPQMEEAVRKAQAEVDRLQRIKPIIAPDAPPKEDDAAARAAAARRAEEALRTAEARRKAAEETRKRDARLVEESTKGWIAHAEAVFQAAEEELRAMARIQEERDRQLESEALRRELAQEQRERDAEREVELLAARRDAYRDLIDPSREYLKVRAELDKLVRAGLMGEEEALLAQRRAFEARHGVRGVAEQVDLAAESARALGLSFTSAFDRVIEGAGRGVRAMELLRAAAMDVAKVIWGRQVIQPFASGLERGLSGLFNPQAGPYASGSHTAANVGYLPWAEGGVMTDRGPMPLRKYSRGGIATTPQLAMFGEGAQPEAYVPLPDGRRIPVAMEGGGRPSVVFAPTINIDSRTDRAEVQALVRHELRASERRVMGYWAESQRR
ncbi:MAG TPA: hypothetical protein VM489_09350, partial [Burkholderiales bacterium]|nr:hypothetical protein [Burkholderiales bacterium]